MMGNHFYLLLETPKPNLVAGMKWTMWFGDTQSRKSGGRSIGVAWSILT
jgi:hypothetical protein